MLTRNQNILMKISGKSFDLYVVSLIAMFFALAARHIEMPGLYYDEMLFAPVSFHIAGQTDVQAPIGRSLLGAPITLQPSYLGTLKAYLMAPVLALFGSSPLTLRLPMIVVSACSLWLLAYFTRPRLGNCPTAVFLFLAATDPLFVFTTKIDWGPTTLAALFRLLALGFFLQFTETRRTRDMTATLAACALGLWDKLNFAWLTIAMAVAGVILYRQPVIDWLRTSPKQSAVVLGSAFATYAGLALIEILPSLQDRCSCAADDICRFC